MKKSDRRILLMVLASLAGAISGCRSTSGAHIGPQPVTASSPLSGDEGLAKLVHVLEPRFAGVSKDRSVSFKLVNTSGSPLLLLGGSERSMF